MPRVGTSVCVSNDLNIFNNSVLYQSIMDEHTLHVLKNIFALV